jgi:hypothetical protein
MAGLGTAGLGTAGLGTAVPDTAVPDTAVADTGQGSAGRRDLTAAARSLTLPLRGSAPRFLLRRRSEGAVGAPWVRK